jgi:hypothetical protein
MAKQQNQPKQPQFSDRGLEQMKHYGQALGGVTPSDEEVERHVKNLGSHEKHEANYKRMKAKRQLG